MIVLFLAFVSVLNVATTHVAPTGILPTPVAMPTPPPLPTVPPAPTPSRTVTVTPSPQPTGDPHRFVLEVRPQSLMTVEVVVDGDYAVPPNEPIERPTPATTPFPAPALVDANARTALELTVRTPAGEPS